MRGYSNRARGGSLAAQLTEDVEAAKKEGKLVAYVSMLTENATALLAEFKKKYPFIDTSLYRANTQKLLPKIQLEARTQQHQADVISATFTIWNELTRGKLIMKYDSPERSRFPADLKDADGYWNILHLGVQGMAYNTKLVPPDIAPKSYEDLLHPRWRRSRSPWIIAIAHGWR